MAAAPRRGYARLPWDHERALESEAELAAWLCGIHPGKIIPAGLGPSFRERFKPKFPIDVFSTPDLVYVPEFRGEDGKVTGYGPPFAIDVVDRNYAFDAFPTVYAQSSKTDELTRFDKKRSFLAYKWVVDDVGVWTFARIEDIASLKLKPKKIDTEIRGEKAKQNVYFVPRELWYNQEEFKTLILREIKNFEPVDHVKLLRTIDSAREADLAEYVGLLADFFGKERFREMAKFYLSMQPMIKWNPERELEPSIYILQRVLEGYLNESD